MKEDNIHPRLRILGLFLMMLTIFVFVGYMLGTLLFGGWWWVAVIIFTAYVSIINLVGYLFGDRMILRMYRAKIVSPKEAPRLHQSVQRVNSFFGMPHPRIAIAPINTPNAFTTGRSKKRTVIVATKGLLERLNDRELDGVIAHEFAHAKHRDVLVMTMASTIAGTIAFFSNWFWLRALLHGFRRNANIGSIVILSIVVFLSAIAAVLVRTAISRGREFRADKTGALTIHRPNDLADALEKLARHNKNIPIEVGKPSSASIFIVNPFRGNIVARLFATHPPTEERVKRLRHMALGMVSL